MIDSRSTMSRTVLCALLALLSVTAFCGGALLIASPDGSLLGMSPADLATSVFPDFRWPGVILFTLFGIGGGFALQGTFRHRAWGPKLAMLVGSGQVVWILVQVVMIKSPSILQAVFFALGIAITVLAANANGHTWKPASRRT